MNEEGRKQRKDERMEGRKEGRKERRKEGMNGWVDQGWMKYCRIVLSY